MLKFKVIRKILILAIIYSFPLVIFESYFLAFKREHMNRDEYLYPFFDFIDRIEGPFKYGLHRSNIRKEHPHQNLFEHNNKLNFSKFETDKFGTIKPSDMESGISLGKIDTIFCGGSGTEAGLVWHGERPSDVFSRITGSISINASRAGKDIFGCVKTIDFLLENFAKNGLEKPVLSQCIQSILSLMSLSI